MTGDELIKGQIVLFAWREAGRLGGLNNMLAMCFVLRNRVDAGWNDSDYLAVITDAEASSAHPIKGAGFPDLRSSDMRKLLSQIDAIYSGTAPDHLTNGALFYGDLNNTTEDFRERIIRSPEHQRVAQVGEVYFWK